MATLALVTLTIFRGTYQRQMTLLEECGGQMELIHRCRIENLLGSTVNDTTDVYAADACADHARVEAL